ncbi:hypothetical protein AC578_2990 [Pseudocercospora eumusae]|uniref:Uncharacterized protein n=1 Tax=Pseudocercospora eumusae TaxID=321146 RepID=A0A139GX71_9PEZI|nr:hypothetical protein AC578_2990 [Pseudocercospora eumusae]KXS94782.1 hypothetical protein AC578_2990 [Pseudocercospora eumusae]KXS94783.1 hypothetical protein AC578_2990 [Pseudocercospora eumusae]
MLGIAMTFDSLRGSPGRIRTIGGLLTSEWFRDLFHSFSKLEMRAASAKESRAAQPVRTHRSALPSNKRPNKKAQKY